MKKCTTRNFKFLLAISIISIFSSFSNPHLAFVQEMLKRVEQKITTELVSIGVQPLRQSNSKRIVTADLLMTCSEMVSGTTLATANTNPYSYTGLADGNSFIIQAINGNFTTHTATNAGTDIHSGYQISGTSGTLNDENYVLIFDQPVECVTLYFSQLNNNTSLNPFAPGGGEDQLANFAVNAGTATITHTDLSSGGTNSTNYNNNILAAGLTSGSTSTAAQLEITSTEDFDRVSFDYDFVGGDVEGIILYQLDYTTATPVDSDGDLVNNIDDLDADNDGIHNDIECNLNQEVNEKRVDWINTNIGTALQPVTDATGSLMIDTMVTMVTATAAYPDASYTHVDGSTTPFTGAATDYIQPSLSPTNPSVSFDFGGKTLLDPVLNFYANATTGIYYLDVPFSINAGDAIQTGTVFTANSIGEITINLTGNITNFTLTNFATTTEEPFLQIGTLQMQECVDTDGDGFADYLDLDSDGDTCFDTEEIGVADSEPDGIAGTGLPTVNADGTVSGLTYSPPLDEEWRDANISTACEFPITPDGGSTCTTSILGTDLDNANSNPYTYTDLDDPNELMIQAVRGNYTTYTGDRSPGNIHSGYQVSGASGTLLNDTYVLTFAEPIACATLYFSNFNNDTNPFDAANTGQDQVTNFRVSQGTINLAHTNLSTGVNGTTFDGSTIAATPLSSGQETAAQIEITSTEAFDRIVFDYENIAGNPQGIILYGIKYTTTTYIDTDGDLVIDKEDLDADNDGILDADECGLATAPTEVGTDWTNTTISSVVQPTTDATGTLTIDNQTATITATAAYPDATYTHVDGSTTPFAGNPTDYLKPSLADATPTIIFNTGTKTLINPVLHLYNNAPTADYYINIPFNIISGDAIQNGVTFTANSIGGEVVIELIGQVTDFELTNISGSLREPFLQLSTQNIQECVDTDNDMVTDNLSLDADADGCFDSQEAEVDDSEPNGLAGTDPVSVDAQGRVVGITYVSPPTNQYQDNTFTIPCDPPFDPGGSSPCAYVITNDTLDSANSNPFTFTAGIDGNAMTIQAINGNYATVQASGAQGDKHSGYQMSGVSGALVDETYVLTFDELLNCATLYFARLNNNANPLDATDGGEDQLTNFAVNRGNATFTHTNLSSGGVNTTTFLNNTLAAGPLSSGNGTAAQIDIASTEAFDRITFDYDYVAGNVEGILLYWINYTTAPNIDSDSDLVNNIDDLDADNDGILNADECNLNISTTEQRIDWTATTIATPTQPLTEVIGDLVVDTLMTTVTATASYPDASYTHVDASTSPFAGDPTDYIKPSLTNVNPTVSFDFGGKTLVDPILHFYANSPTGTFYISEPFILQSGAATQTDVIFEVTNIGEITIQLVGEIAQVSLTNYSGSTREPFLQIGTQKMQECRDTDGDNLADYLDIDSDDDACFDTEEAGIVDSEPDGRAGTGNPAVNADGTVSSITYVSPANNDYRDANVFDACNLPIDPDGGSTCAEEIRGGTLATLDSNPFTYNNLDDNNEMTIQAVGGNYVAYQASRTPGDTHSGYQISGSNGTFEDDTYILTFAEPLECITFYFSHFNNNANPFDPSDGGQDQLTNFRVNEGTISLAHTNLSTGINATIFDGTTISAGPLSSGQEAAAQMEITSTEPFDRIVFDYDFIAGSPEGIILYGVKYTTATLTNTDGDGLVDADDLDDDNDGLLDDTECDLETSPTEVRTDWTTTTISNIAQPETAATGTLTIGMQEVTVTATAAYPSAANEHVDNSTSPFAGDPTDYIRPELSLANPTVAFDLGTKILTDPTLHLYANDASVTYYLNVPFTIANGDAVQNGVTFTVNTIGEITITLTGLVDDFELTNVSGSVQNPFLQLGTQKIHECTDSDGDMVIDAREIDADNDGCFDTQEAGIDDGEPDGLAGSSPVNVDVDGTVIGATYASPINNNWRDANNSIVCDPPFMPGGTPTCNEMVISDTLNNADMNPYTYPTFVDGNMMTIQAMNDNFTTYSASGATGDKHSGYQMSGGTGALVDETYVLTFAEPLSCLTLYFTQLNNNPNLFNGGNIDQDQLTGFAINNGVMTITHTDLSSNGNSTTFTNNTLAAGALSSGTETAAKLDITSTEAFDRIVFNYDYISGDVNGILFYWMDYTTAILPDFDNDGVVDENDLDADNDGILDDIECNYEDATTAQLTDWTSTATSNVLTPIVAATGQLTVNGLVADMTALASYPAANTHVDNATSPFAITTDYIRPDLSTDNPTITFGFDDKTLIEPTLRFYSNSVAGRYYIDVPFEIISGAATRTGSVFDVTAVGEVVITLSNLVDTFSLTNFSGVNQAPFLQIGTAKMQQCIDTDLDGLPDYQDRDADGDFCFDTEEVGINDPEPDGIAGTGTPSVDTDGKVVGEAYTAPADGNWRDVNESPNCEPPIDPDGGSTCGEEIRGTTLDNANSNPFTYTNLNDDNELMIQAVNDNYLTYTASRTPGDTHSGYWMSGNTGNQPNESYVLMFEKPVTCITLYLSNFENNIDVITPANNAQDQLSNFQTNSEGVVLMMHTDLSTFPNSTTFDQTTLAAGLQSSGIATAAQLEITSTVPFDRLSFDYENVIGNPTGILLYGLKYTTFNPDEDSDGVADRDDLDDDNDGISDAVECGRQDEGIIKRTDWMTTNTATIVAQLTDAEGTITVNGLVADVIATASYPDVNHNHVDNSTTPFAGDPTDYIRPDLTITTPTVSFNFNEKELIDPVLRMYANGGTGRFLLDVPFHIQSGNAVQNGTVFDVTAIGEIEIVLDSMVSKFNLTNVSGVDQAPFLQVETQLLQFCVDSDGDGIADCLEIDADNDGCFDTRESDIPDTEPDGRAATSPVTVDADGMVVGAPYTAPLNNYWQDPNINEACLTPIPGGVTDNLALWLKADVGITESFNRVTNWEDQSAFGNDVANDGLLGNVARPRYLTGDAINFNPAVDFERSGFQGLNGMVSVLQDVDEFTTFYVLNKESSDGVIFSQEGFSVGNVNPSVKSDGSITTSLTNGTQLNVVTPATDDIPQLFTGVRSVNVNNWTQSSTLNGGEATNSVTESGIPVPLVVDFRLGYRYRNTSMIASNFLDGKLGELVIYDRSLTDLEKQQVQSYLGIKYGITLVHDYLASDGTRLWDTDNSQMTYSNDIAGIGRDNENSCLYQKQSRSVNDDAIITMGLTSIEASNGDNFAVFPDDKSFLLWGNDNGSDGLTPTWTEVGAPLNYLILNREWHIEETGTIGDISLSVDVNNTNFNLPTPAAGNNYYLVIDQTTTDGSYTDETPIQLYDDGTNGDQTAGDGIWTANGIDFPNSTEFTIASEMPVTGWIPVLTTAVEGAVLNPLSTGVSNLCIGCFINDPELLLDEDTTGNFAVVGIPVGVAGSSSISTLTADDIPAGTSVGYVIESTTGLIDVALADNIIINTYQDGVLQESFPLSNSLVSVAALAGSNTINTAGFVTSLAADEIQIQFLGTNVLQEYQVYNVFAELVNGPGGVANNIATWLRADDRLLNSGNVELWTDQGTRGNNASQNTVVNQPIFINNAVNFNPAVNFNGFTHQMAFTNSVGLSGQNPSAVLAAVVAGAGDRTYLGDSRLGDPDQQLFLNMNNGQATKAVTGAAEVCAGTTTNMVAISEPALATYVRTSNTEAYIDLNGQQDNVFNCTGIHADERMLLGAKGGTSNIDNHYVGLIPEIVTYDRALTEEETERIESYLAIKYGITLGHNYYASDWDGTAGTVLYDITETDGDSLYDHNIAGIAKDSVISVLHQTQSKSINPEAILTIGLGAIDNSNLDNIESGNLVPEAAGMMWGSTEGAAIWTNEDAPADFKILERQWRIQETSTSTVGGVKMQFDVSNPDFDVPDLELGTVYYLVADANNNQTLIDDTPLALVDAGGGIWETATNIDFGDGIEFTLATERTVTVAPVITSTNTVVVAENITTPVLNVESTDADGDAEGNGLVYSLTSTGIGLDNTLFTIDTVTGELSFLTPPNFESPQDADTNNDYIVEVQVCDSNSDCSQQLITVMITDVCEAVSPTITND